MAIAKILKNVKPKTKVKPKPKPKSKKVPYSKKMMDALRRGGFKQGNRGSFGYDIIREKGVKKIELYGTLTPKVD